MSKQKTTQRLHQAGPEGMVIVVDCPTCGGEL